MISSYFHTIRQFKGKLAKKERFCSIHIPQLPKPYKMELIRKSNVIWSIWYGIHIIPTYLYWKIYENMLICNAVETSLKYIIGLQIFILGRKYECQYQEQLQTICTEHDSFSVVVGWRGKTQLRFKTENDFNLLHECYSVASFTLHV